MRARGTTSVGGASTHPLIHLNSLIFENVLVRGSVESSPPEYDWDA